MSRLAAARARRDRRRSCRSSSTSIATSLAQPSGSSAIGAKNFMQRARRAITATSATDALDVGYDVRCPAPAVGLPPMTERMLRRHDDRRIAREQALAGTRRGETHVRATPARSRCAAVAHDDDVAGCRVAPDHQVEVARRPADERAVERGLAREVAPARNGVRRLERRAGARSSRMPSPASSTSVRSTPGKRRERAVALDVGDADAPREGGQRLRPAGPPRSRACVRRRSSTACGDSPRGPARRMSFRWAVPRDALPPRGATSAASVGAVSSWCVDARSGVESGRL